MQTNKSICVSIVNGINVAYMQLQREHLLKDKTQKQKKTSKKPKKEKKTNQQNKNRNRG